MKYKIKKLGSIYMEINLKIYLRVLMASNFKKYSKGNKIKWKKNLSIIMEPHLKKYKTITKEYSKSKSLPELQKNQEINN